MRQIAALVSLMLALASPEALAQARMNMPSLPLPSLGPAPLPVPNPAPTAPLPPPPAGQVGLFLSAAFAKHTESSDYFLGTTVDQIAAREMGRDTQLASLQLAMDLNPLAGVCNNGY